MHSKGTKDADIALCRKQTQRTKRMKNVLLILCPMTMCLLHPVSGSKAYPRAEKAEAGSHAAYLGFDVTEYPGDSHLASLRRTFSFAGYWLNVPPGATNNTWVGKRNAIKEAGFGFLVLFNGRPDRELRWA